MILNLSAIKLFAFDFDGTLVDSNHIKSQAFTDVTPEDKHTHLKSIMENNSNFNRYQIFDALGMPELAESYGAQCEKLILEAEEIPGASALLQVIKDKGKMAIINSATPKEPLERIVEQLPLAPYIGAVYGAPATKANNLHNAISVFEAAPEEIIVVGDRENDREAAQVVGCKFAGIRSALSDFIKEPAIVGDDLNFLVEALSNV